MASEATPLGSVEVQTTGENLNTWGEILNATITRLTEMAVGALELTITGNVALDNEKYVVNESRSACLSFIGSGLTAAPVITLPAEARQWMIVNRDPTYAMTLKVANSAATPVSVNPYSWAIVYSDGVDLFINDLSNLSGLLPIEFLQSSPAMSVLGNLSNAAAAPGGVTVVTDLTNASDTTLATSAASKAYTDALRDFVNSLPQINLGTIQDNLPASNTVAINIASGNTVAANMPTLLGGLPAIQTVSDNIQDVRDAAIIATSLVAAYVNLDVATALEANGQYRFTTVGLTHTMPADPAIGDTIFFADGEVINATGADGETVALDGGPNPIMGSTDPLVVDVRGIRFALWWNGADWRLF